ncbi:uncharacterized protein EV420DRAFT_778032 [Desarmillaria tabescens]|uniref:F-box domain-containing protein n=1 Tax=Armillaria tabescens TaxID=1929756 RepID=A0AA39JXF8_ARMTA|nr:uncharacterized protein EV420DRAFT_778032 [Desarmillaria tabescens]KAK0449606.1 hypothetical protein EV420DRAFT_778032 [Desarmillaria tabescens]
MSRHTDTNFGRASRDSAFRACPFRMSELPPEIVDTVIDHLHDDKAALGACTLVCKSWSISSRYHLFDEHGVSVKPSNIHDFLSDISHSQSLLRDHLRCLTLRTEFALAPKQTFEWKDISISLPHLPKLVSLRVHSQTQHIRFSYHVIPVIFLPQTLQNITHLEVVRTSVHAADDIISLMCLFSRLRGAQFSWIHWRNCSSLISSLNAAFPPLKQLSLLHPRSPGEVIRCLSRLDPVPLLPRIDVGHIDTPEIPSVNRYLYILGSSLDMFCVGLNDKYGTLLFQFKRQCLDRIADTTLDLSQNTSLRCLRLLECQAASPTINLARVIQHVKSTNLEILALDIYQWYVNSAAADWEALDQYLLELWDVLRLKAVYIVTVPFANFSRKLPRCDSQIILHIRTSSQIQSFLNSL